MHHLFHLIDGETAMTDGIDAHRLEPAHHLHAEERLRHVTVGMIENFQSLSIPSEPGEKSEMGLLLQAQTCQTLQGTMALLTEVEGLSEEGEATSVVDIQQMTGVHFGLEVPPENEALREKGTAP